MQIITTHMNTEAITFGLGAVGPMVAGGAGALKHICTVVLQHMTCSSMLTMQLLALLTADTCWFMGEKRRGSK